MKWKCATCGIEHDEIPLCFSSDAPWSMLVPETEFTQRVELSPDQCVVDGKTFFIRGHIEIPIHDYPDLLSFSVWSSLSEKSFMHMSERWEVPNRASDPPYFGFLCTSIPVYRDTVNLKLSIQSRAPGLTPLFMLEPTDHPLAIDQREGITRGKWHDLVHKLLHSDSVGE